jgi:hypothetical protein
MPKNLLLLIYVSMIYQILKTKLFALILTLKNNKIKTFLFGCILRLNLNFA